MTNHDVGLFAIGGLVGAWAEHWLWRIRSKSRDRGGNIGDTPLVRNEGRSTFSPSSVTVKGLDWPATVGEFTLVGLADNAGAWRWYERRTGHGIERVRLDHQLRPMGLSPHRQSW